MRRAGAVPKIFIWNKTVACAEQNDTVMESALSLTQEKKYGIKKYLYLFLHRFLYPYTRIYL